MTVLAIDGKHNALKQLCFIPYFQLEVHMSQRTLVPTYPLLPYMNIEVFYGSSFVSYLYLLLIKIFVSKIKELLRKPFNQKK
jgi:hypothetical protein